jgi:hypothetical protein
MIPMKDADQVLDVSEYLFQNKLEPELMHHEDPQNLSDQSVREDQGPGTNLYDTNQVVMSIFEPQILR